MSTQKIFLVGLPGAGKTTLGKKVAEKLGLNFYDLDHEIIKLTGKSISDTFDQEGEEYFRSVEKTTLQKLIEEESSFVLATGGGTPCFNRNMELMNEVGVTVFINTPIDVIKERLMNDSKRPLMKKYSLEDLISKRESWYNLASIKENQIDVMLNQIKSLEG